MIWIKYAKSPATPKSVMNYGGLRLHPNLKNIHILEQRLQHIFFNPISRTLSIQSCPSFNIIIFLELIYHKSDS